MSLRGILLCLVGPECELCDLASQLALMREPGLSSEIVGARLFDCCLLLLIDSVLVRGGPQIEEVLDQSVFLL